MADRGTGNPPLTEPLGPYGPSANASTHGGGRAARSKGLQGEREVAAIFEREGFEVRGLESGGDHLCIVAPLHYDSNRWTDPGFTIHSEVKRQERLQLWQWLAQLEAEAPAGTLPMLSFRRNRSPWYACVPLEALVKVLA